MDEWEQEFEAQRPSSVGELMHGLVDQQMSTKMTANQRAAAAWFRANGDRERNHTTGVFLKRPRTAGADPALGVYVDSHVMATDFGVNKDIYLARLANVGFMVSGIEFIPSRTGRKARTAREDVQHMTPHELPQLSQDERERIDLLVADLPESLRESVSKAISMSMRREKLEKGQNEKQG